MSEGLTPEFSPPLDRATCKTVLVVVEDASIRELISLNLRHAGFAPISAVDRDAGRQILDEVVPDALLVDVDPHVADGISWARELKAMGCVKNVPVVMITRRASELCGSSGERCGADDCVDKPFSPRELVGRLHHLFARTTTSTSTPERVLRFGPLVLYPERHAVVVERDGVAHRIEMPRGEFRLLQFLMAHPSRVHSRARMLREVWGAGALDERTVDVGVKRLRERLAKAKVSGLIQTVLGSGYRIEYDQPIRRS